MKRDPQHKQVKRKEGRERATRVLVIAFFALPHHLFAICTSITKPPQLRDTVSTNNWFWVLSSIYKGDRDLVPFCCFGISWSARTTFPLWPLNLLTIGSGGLNGEHIFQSIIYFDCCSSCVVVAFKSSDTRFVVSLSHPRQSFVMLKVVRRTVPLVPSSWVKNVNRWLHVDGWTVERCATCYGCTVLRATCQYVICHTSMSLTCHVKMYVVTHLCVLRGLLY